jgi:hypothetical protein
MAHKTWATILILILIFDDILFWSPSFSTSELKKCMGAINKKYDTIFQKAGASQTHGSWSLQRADESRLKAIASLTTGAGIQPPCSQNPPHTNKEDVIKQSYFGPKNDAKHDNMRCCF